jgi:hypothetical protein
MCIHTHMCVLCARMCACVCVACVCVLCAFVRGVCACVFCARAQQLIGFHKIGTNVMGIGGGLTPYLKFPNKIRTCEFLTEQDYNKMYRPDTS